MNAYKQEDLDVFFEMVRKSLEILINELKLGIADSEILSSQLMMTYHGDIMEIINMPFGDTLAPEEYAEMVLLKYFNAHSSDEAAASLGW